MKFAPPQPPVLRRLSDDQAELCWQGRPFLFDRRSRTISRAGRAIVRFDAVRWIRISANGDNDEWRVILDIGIFRNIVVGTALDPTDASVAAAHIATVMNKKVRVL